MKKRGIIASLTIALAIVCGTALTKAEWAWQDKELAEAGQEIVAAAEEAAAEVQPAAPATVQSNPDRDVFFGQTHLHTSWSMDAYLLGNHITTPEDAYKYATGMPVKHPAGFEVQLKGRPLDFQGVTDHSEYAGVIAIANDPTSDLSKQPIAQKLKVETPEQFGTVFRWLAGSLATHQPIKELLDPAIAGSVWKKNNDMADKYYKPGTFTTFAAYEWTSAPKAQNMHRNVFFRDTKRVPVLPFSAIDSLNVEDLWTWMDGQRKAGNEVLAISHNANLSNGMMFPLDVDSKGRPIDAAWAQQRINNEPLTEIQQIKGTSETNPGLSPNDEFANFEIMSFLLGTPDSTSKLNGSYIREAYQNGLAMQVKRGYNPYKMGVVGASDSHNTIASYYQSENVGSHASADLNPKERLAGKVESGMEILKTGLSALGGVWAESNTRESIFDAMKRKEVFGSSGVRIKVRLFGGWNFQDDVLKDANWVKAGYKNGVPMGADLPAKKGEAPSFIVWATKDPEDGNLDRIQIVKGWTKDGQIFEKVFDVVWSGDRKPDPATGKVPAVGDTVDIKTATYKNTIGAVELKKVWKDPEFDPSVHAFYYVRVLQIPTPRWSTYDAAKLGIAPPDGVPATEQQRAWSSPIWYTPSQKAALKGDAGTTIAELNEKGADVLDDTELKELLVGNTLTVRNTLTGERFNITFDENGSRTIQGVDKRSVALDQIGALLPKAATTAQYAISGSRVSTDIGGLPFELVVYKFGDKYVAARAGEFGYVNYEFGGVGSRLAGAFAKR